MKKKVKKKLNLNPIRIVVLQRGWVAVGRYSQVNEECLLSPAFVIRRWGTTMGLGELAQKGPQPNTALEPALSVRFHRSGEVFTMDVDETKWSL